MKTALITGVAGQDGTYLTEHLLSLGYKVFGLIRKGPQQNVYTYKWLIHQLWKDRVEFLYGDMRDEMSLRAAIRKSWPDEIYNLAGQVFVPVSWEFPEETFNVNTGGLARILKIVEQVKKDARVYQASSSEMYGNHEGACTDETPMAPTSPYGISKYAAHRLAGLYRSRGLYVVAGILFNHESPRRGHEMVTRKIARHVAEWKAGSTAVLKLGNMDSRRDWGFAGEYVKAMHLMLQQDKPDDYVVGTGESHSVGDFLTEATELLGIDRTFVSKHLETDYRLVRTQEIYNMRADNTKIRTKLKWEPKVVFPELVRMMTLAELDRVKTDQRRMYEEHPTAGEHTGDVIEGTQEECNGPQRDNVATAGTD